MFNWIIIQATETDRQGKRCQTWAAETSFSMVPNLFFLNKEHFYYENQKSYLLKQEGSIYSTKADTRLDVQRVLFI